MSYSNLIFYCRPCLLEFLYRPLNYRVPIGQYFCYSVVIFGFVLMEFDIVYEIIHPPQLRFVVHMYVFSRYVPSIFSDMKVHTCKHELFPILSLYSVIFKYVFAVLFLYTNHDVDIEWPRKRTDCSGRRTDIVFQYAFTANGKQRCLQFRSL
jgi:hypothetical protein